MLNVMTPDSKISNGGIEMDNVYLCHHGVKGQKWGVRKTPEQKRADLQSKVLKKYSRYVRGVNAHNAKSFKYLEKAGKQTRFTKIGVAKSDKYIREHTREKGRAIRVGLKGSRYISRMKKRHPEIFDEKMQKLMLSTENNIQPHPRDMLDAHRTYTDELNKRMTEGR